MKSEQSTVSQRLDEIMMDLGFNAKEFADYLNISESSISRFRQDKKLSTTRVQRLKKLETEHGYDLMWIAEGEGEKFKWQKTSRVAIGLSPLQVTVFMNKLKI